MGSWRLEAGLIHLNKHQYEEAEKRFQGARVRFEEAGKMEGVARGHQLSSRAYRFKSHYPKALEHAGLALELYDSLEDRNGQAQSYQSIGRVHWAQDNNKSAKEAFEKAARLFRESGDAHGIASSHDLVGRYYLEYEEWDSASAHFKKALKHYKGSGNRKGMAYSRVEYGEVMLQLGETDSAKRRANEALEVFREYQDPTGIIQCQVILGRSFLEEERYDSAIARFRSALPHAKRVKSYEELERVHDHLAEAYHQKGAHSRAYSELRKAEGFKDSLASKEKREKMAELEAKFEMREREKELELKESQLQKKAMQQDFLLGGLSLFLLYSGFLFYQVRQKKKANHALLEKNRLIREKNREIFQSLRYASRIQNAVLPEEQILHDTLDSGFILFKPRDMVSGDLYWIEKEKGRLYMAVVDCTGHGVPGALISLLGHNALNKAVKEKGLQDPAEILSFLDDQMKETFQQKEGEEGLRDGMDIALCSFDPNEKELLFAGAIEPLYLAKKDGEEILEYKGDRKPIGRDGKGQVGQKKFNTHRIQVREGDRFYISSDGFPDQFGGEKGKKLKYKRFRKMLFEGGKVDDLEDQKADLLTSLENWQGDHEQVDDILVIGARV